MSRSWKDRATDVLVGLGVVVNINALMAWFRAVLLIMLSPVLALAYLIYVLAGKVQ